MDTITRYLIGGYTMPSPHDAKAVARRAFQFLDRKSRRWSGEEEVRLAWISALETATGFDFEAERKKKDSSFNNVIIEFKAPGLFHGSKASAKFKEATQKRLLPYIKRAAKETGIPRGDFIGIAIDGEHVCFCQVVGNNIQAGHLLTASEQSVGMVIAACLGSTRRAVTSENLVLDFGHTSSLGVAVMQVLADALARALKRTASSKIRMLFEEWATLYGQVADLSAAQVGDIDRVLRFNWNGPAKWVMPGRLFVIHTYNSLLIKLLAAEIVSAHGLTTIEAPAEAMCAVLTPADLIQRLAIDVERGGLFAGAGINGFVEEAIFSWYLDVARDPAFQKDMVSALKAILGQLSLYRTDHLDRQRDTLRDFYQSLIPEALRKSLGEFYTPDWLVDFTISEAAPKKYLGKRFLDPTCGSGSFLIEVIRRKRREATAAGLGAAKTLRVVCEQTWGFDLNPLAVQTARVNYLMEVTDLLAAAKGTQIEIPVLLADAIYSPAPDPRPGSRVVEYKIGSQAASLTIILPSDLAFNRDRLDQVFEVMGEHVENDDEFDTVRRAFVRGAILSEKESKAWANPLRETYNQVLALHRKNWNGIWFRIVRNFFWSATAGKFDLIVGNPPWVRWSKLPNVYRERVKPTCAQYDIFSQTSYHGGNELDISAMITYTTGDKWLRDGGALAFVITQAVFQNPSSSGFRNFSINNTDNLVPLVVNDMKALKPFPEAANKTAVVVFRKTKRSPAYPVDYVVWGAAQGETRTIDPTLPFSDVLAKTTRTTLEANPVAGKGSPWAILPTGRFSQLNALSEVDESPWVEGRKGITVDLNGVYFVRVLGQNKANETMQIQSRPEAGKKDIGPVQTRFVEPDWLHPLIKGAGDFTACHIEPKEELFAIVPNNGIRKADFEAAQDGFARQPLMRKYLSGFRPLLEQRSTWRGRMAAVGAPYYAVYNVGDFTFKPWKVIWAEMSGEFCAAVAGSALVPFEGLRPYVPDHKIFFVAMEEKAEAHYLCGLLNSNVVRQYVESHNVAIQVGDIFKHMRLPQFNPSRKAHRDLANEVEKAHQEANAKKRQRILDTIRAKSDQLLTNWLKRASKP